MFFTFEWCSCLSLSEPQLHRAHHECGSSASWHRQPIRNTRRFCTCGSRSNDSHGLSRIQVTISNFHKYLQVIHYLTAVASLDIYQLLIEKLILWWIANKLNRKIYIERTNKWAMESLILRPIPHPPHDWTHRQQLKEPVDGKFWSGPRQQK